MSRDCFQYTRNPVQRHVEATDTATRTVCDDRDNTQVRTREEDVQDDAT